jgi:REP element-mobilizing transposase RayT
MKGYMPVSRQPRKLSESGLYHVVFRGVNHCHLFEEKEDFAKLFEILASIKEELPFELYAYCLLDNHVHLLIKENAPKELVSVMRRLLSPYAVYFNRKYGRSGALIADRYKSECVESNEYLLVLIRYIHQNPVRAGMATRIDSYSWSSYNVYLGKREGLVNTDFVLGMFAGNQQKAREEFISFHRQSDGEDYSLPVLPSRSERQVRDEMAIALGEIVPHAVGSLPKAKRDSVLSDLRQRGFSVRQIERVTGVSRGVIQKFTGKT